MTNIWILVINFIVILCFTHAGDTDLVFPKDLKFGAGTSAHQIEGAWNVGGKSESVWDNFTHTHPEKISGRNNANVACNSYYKYKEDVALIKEMGLDYYRFSVSWPRILPNISADEVNEEGIQYYLNLTRELIANGIEPVVTIYHWDHPQRIQDLGGWTNEAIVEYLVDYARVVFQRLGPYVKTWITINEPKTMCNFGFLIGGKPPDRVGDRSGHHLCLHNVLKAHAAIWHLYDDEFRATQSGKIGFTTSCYGYVSTDESGDASVIDQAFQFDCGWILNPVVKGDYPEIVKKRIAMISEMEGYSSPCLPKFTEEWIDYINGTHDFIGLNHYTTYVPRPDPYAETLNYSSESGVLLSVDPSWPTTNFRWLFIIPEGFGNMLRMIRDNYDNPTVYIFEHGFSDDGRLDDFDRINFHYLYLIELFKAIKRDGCGVQRYTIWSLLDNFEWSHGYEAHFGLISVDFTSENRTRSKKLSTSWLKDSIAARELQPVPSKNRLSSGITDRFVVASDGRQVVGDKRFILTVLGLVNAYYTIYTCTAYS